MCGIIGYYRSEASEWLNSSLPLIRHRGPDDEGFQIFTEDGVGLGHRRLSIIDLSEAGRQPMTNEDGTLWLTFNGEIYNYKDLRADLESRGHPFRSNTDSEVLLHLYEEEGLEMVRRLRGMFSFALWDQRRKRLFLARDPLGIKPLYYCRTPQGFFFCSEIKPLLRAPGISVSPDWTSLDDYLSFLYVPSPRTLFKGIQRLPPAHALTLDTGGRKEWAYWDLPLEAEGQNGHGTAEYVLENLKSSVQAHLVSDVPVGLYLSGGVDSSVIAAVSSRLLGQRLRSFTLKIVDEDRRYESGPDDAFYARRVAKELGLEHTEITVKPQVADILERVVQTVEEPISDPSSVASYLLCQEAHQAGMKVLLSGIGGDEAFAGYPRHQAGLLSQYYRQIPTALRQRVLEPLFAAFPAGAPGRMGVFSRRLKALGLNGSLPFEDGYIGYSSYGFPLAYRKGLYQDGSLLPAEPNRAHREHLSKTLGHPILQRMLYLDLKTFQPDQNLNHLDKTSMAHSIEVRVPFVDRLLLEAIWAIAPGLKLRGWKTKYILKKAAESLLPHSVVWRKKSVFTIPTRSWLRGCLRPMVEELLSDTALRKRGLFRPESIRQILREFERGQEDHHLRIWTLMTLELWMRSFLDRAPSPEVVS